MVPKQYKSQESGYDYFQSKECKPIQMNVTHTKTKIACHNVTKQNCVTKWKIENGEKVSNSTIDLFCFISKSTLNILSLVCNDCKTLFYP